MARKVQSLGPTVWERHDHSAVRSILVWNFPSQNFQLIMKVMWCTFVINFTELTSHHAVLTQVQNTLSHVTSTKFKSYIVKINLQVLQRGISS